ncbi:MAG: transglycosylase [Thermomicrobiales bacterium]|nr:MAG: transglycosylase [Thermomicrobiales bacterium]
MSVVAWIIFGALAGWVASKLAGTDDRMGCLANILVGVAGAAIGGAAYKIIFGEEWTWGFNLPSFIVAVIGSIALLALLKWLRGRPA